MRTNAKIILGIIVAVLLSTVSCYVLAQNLINSKDVVYEDNSNLVADNVQDAIDGTCSKIDTRLSIIEDKLYTVENISDDVGFTSQTSNFYTGASVRVLSNSYCSITVTAVWSNSAPTGLFLSKSSTTLDNNLVATGIKIGANYTLTYSFYSGYYTIYYVWANYSSVSSNRVSINGFCASKYK